MNLPEVPKHLAIIMDGNGRWAEVRGKHRTFGHLKGARVAKRTIEFCADAGVKNLTLYAFSTENWMRPEHEVSFLMQLLGRHLRKERATLMRNNIRFFVIGQIDRLPLAVQAEVLKTVEITRGNTGMELTFALSYGSRQELTDAVKAIGEDILAGRLLPKDIDESLIRSRLQTSYMSDPDLIIRTSGEYRLSNFLLWQAAYSELYITEMNWPDFNDHALLKAFAHYSSRERRFGKTTAQVVQKKGRISSIAELVRLTALQRVNI